MRCVYSTTDTNYPPSDKIDVNDTEDLPWAVTVTRLVTPNFSRRWSVWMFSSVDIGHRLLVERLSPQKVNGPGNEVDQGFTETRCLYVAIRA